VGLEELSRAELMELAVVQHVRIVQLEGRVAEQDRRIEELAGEVDRLRRVTSRNSGNSSLPASKDDEVGRKPAERREPRRSGCRPGKQGGAQGKALAWVGDPVVVDHLPRGLCDECGVDLDGAVDAGVERACQITDVPLVSASTTEHRMHRVRCECGRVHTAPPPAGAGMANTRVYGPNLKALTVYLLVRHALPVERAAELIADVAGAAPSAGWVHGLLARVAGALGEVTKLIKTLVTASYVVHLDETPIRCGPVGAKEHVWVASNALFTAFYLGGRGLEDLRSFAVTAGFTGVAVHDRYRVYTGEDTREAGKKVFGAGVRHQVCAAHLIRDFQDAAESLPSQYWPAQAKRALRELIHAANQARQAGLPAVPADDAAPPLKDFRHAVRAGLSQVPRIDGAGAQPKFRALLEFLRDHQDQVTLFVSDTAVPPTNNQGETDLRPHKTQQKISGRLRDPNTTKDRLTIAGYLSTARKHRQNALTVLRDAITGTPWTPPAPS
jgi:transposase